MAFPLTNTYSYIFILDVEDIYLPFIPMGRLTDTNAIRLPNVFNIRSGAINTLFPFGDSVQTTVFVRFKGEYFITIICVFFCRWDQMVFFLLVGHTIFTTIGHFLCWYEITLLLHFGTSYIFRLVVGFFMRSMRVVIPWNKSTHFCK